SVDPELVARPRRWDMRFIARFMIEFGCLSSCFDFVTFGVLLGFGAKPELFRSGWFVESLLTQIVAALVVRTRRPLFKSRPGRFMSFAPLAIAALAIAIPFIPHADLLGFTPLPPYILALLIAITTLYALTVELFKARFYASLGS